VYHMNELATMGHHCKHTKGGACKCKCNTLFKGTYNPRSLSLYDHTIDPALPADAPTMGPTSFPTVYPTPFPTPFPTISPTPFSCPNGCRICTTPAKCDYCSYCLSLRGNWCFYSGHAVGVCH
jgi:hypothetical protein